MKVADKPKMGRPKLPKGVAKSRIIMARFAPDAFERVERAARADKKSVSGWIHDVVTAALQLITK